MSYHLLSEPLRKYIRDKHWDELRPIQHAAIEKILSTDENYILASRTASGKTEAAFLPILSKVNFNETGIQVLYISPLIALINDQFQRIEEICEYLDISVTKWHGEANKTLKEKILKKPSGIILITPESLEAMFVTKPFNVKQLFSNLKFVIIDEIHSFLGTDRGTQLKSLLFRLQNVNEKKFRIVGLSATVGDYSQAKKLTGNENFTKILLDKAKKDVDVQFRFFESEKSDDFSITFLKNLYQATENHKVLIFPNTRGKVEEIAVKLKKIAQLVNGHSNYFSHHSSVDKEVREYVEFFAKNRRENFCISCTSTLELGIDIGAIDKVIQIDATNSISSLVQRLGRSGRKDSDKSQLILYATNQWSLLQSLACWQLYTENFIEPPFNIEKPYDILLHQILSVAKERSGMAKNELINFLNNNFAFANIEISEINEIIEHLIQLNFLEKLRNEVIIGIDGEFLVNHRDFFSVFKVEEEFRVVNSGNTIGKIPFTPQIMEDANIFLAAQVWKIKFIDTKTKKIEVIKTSDGKKPVYFGQTMPVHAKIREKMLEILFTKQLFPILNDLSFAEIEKMRKDFSIFDIKNLQSERPLFYKENKLRFFSFESTKVNRTLLFLFKIFGIEILLNDAESCFDLEISVQAFFKTIQYFSKPLENINYFLTEFLEKNPNILDFSKYGNFLPQKFKLSLLKEKVFDFENTILFLNSVKFCLPR